jgi:hypothetical protein
LRPPDPLGTPALASLRALVDDIEAEEASWRGRGNRSVKRKSEGAREWGKTLESSKTLKDGVAWKVESV